MFIYILIVLKVFVLLFIISIADENFTCSRIYILRINIFPYKFTYLGSSVSSTEKDIDTRLTKAWSAIDKLSIIWKSDLTDKMKRIFFQAAVVSILLYGCTILTLTKRLEKSLTAQECCKQYWTSPGGNTPQSTNYTATCLLSRKLSKLDEPDMQDTARGAWTRS